MKWILLSVATIGLFVFGYFYVSQNPPTGLQVASSTPNVATLNAGRTLFRANCASCHGQGAVGVEGAGPPFIHIIYEPNHHADASFYAAVKNGVRAHHWPYGNMPPQPQVAQEEMEKIIAYIRKIQRQNGIE